MLTTEAPKLNSQRYVTHWPSDCVPPNPAVPRATFSVLLYNEKCEYKHNNYKYIFIFLPTFAHNRSRVYLQSTALAIKCYFPLMCVNASPVQVKVGFKSFI